GRLAMPTQGPDGSDRTPADWIDDSAIPMGENVEGTYTVGIMDGNYIVNVTWDVYDGMGRITAHFERGWREGFGAAATDRTVTGYDDYGRVSSFTEHSWNQGNGYSELKRDSITYNGYGQTFSYHETFSKNGGEPVDATIHWITYDAKGRETKKSQTVSWTTSHYGYVPGLSDGNYSAQSTNDWSGESETKPAGGWTNGTASVIIQTQYNENNQAIRISVSGTVNAYNESLVGKKGYSGSFTYSFQQYNMTYDRYGHQTSSDSMTTAPTATQQKSGKKSKEVVKNITTTTHNTSSNFDEYGRARTNVSTYSNSGGSGWSRVTNIQYDSLGLVLSQDESYTNHMANVAKNTDADVSGTRTVTNTYNDRNQLIRTLTNVHNETSEISQRGCTEFINSSMGKIIIIIILIVVTVLTWGAAAPAAGGVAAGTVGASTAATAVTFGGFTFATLGKAVGAVAVVAAAAFVVSFAFTYIATGNLKFALISGLISAFSTVITLGFAGGAAAGAAKAAEGATTATVTTAMQTGGQVATKAAIESAVNQALAKILVQALLKGMLIKAIVGFVVGEILQAVNPDLAFLSGAITSLITGSIDAGTISGELLKSAVKQLLVAVVATVVGNVLSTGNVMGEVRKGEEKKDNAWVTSLVMAAAGFASGGTEFDFKEVFQSVTKYVVNLIKGALNAVAEILVSKMGEWFPYLMSVGKTVNGEIKSTKTTMAGRLISDGIRNIVSFVGDRIERAINPPARMSDAQILDSVSLDDLRTADGSKVDKPLAGVKYYAPFKNNETQSIEVTLGENGAFVITKKGGFAVVYETPSVNAAAATGTTAASQATGSAAKVGLLLGYSDEKAMNAVVFDDTTGAFVGDDATPDIRIGDETYSLQSFQVGEESFIAVAVNGNDLSSERRQVLNVDDKILSPADKQILLMLSDDQLASLMKNVDINGIVRDSVSMSFSADGDTLINFRVSVKSLKNGNMEVVLAGGIQQKEDVINVSFDAETGDFFMEFQIINDEGHIKGVLKAMGLSDSAADKYVNNLKKVIGVDKDGKFQIKNGKFFDAKVSKSQGPVGSIVAEVDYKDLTADAQARAKHWGYEGKSLFVELDVKTGDVRMKMEFQKTVFEAWQKEQSGRSLEQYLIQGGVSEKTAKNVVSAIGGKIENLDSMNVALTLDGNGTVTLKTTAGGFNNQASGLLRESSRQLLGALSGLKDVKASVELSLNAASGDLESDAVTFTPQSKEQLLALIKDQRLQGVLIKSLLQKVIETTADPSKASITVRSTSKEDRQMLFMDVKGDAISQSAQDSIKAMGGKADDQGIFHIAIRATQGANGVVKVLMAPVSGSKIGDPDAAALNMGAKVEMELGGKKYTFRLGRMTGTNMYQVEADLGVVKDFEIAENQSIEGKARVTVTEIAFDDQGKAHVVSFTLKIGGEGRGIRLPSEKGVYYRSGTIEIRNGEIIRGSAERLTELRGKGGERVFLVGRIDVDPLLNGESGEGYLVDKAGNKIGRTEADAILSNLAGYRINMGGEWVRNKAARYENGGLRISLVTKQTKETTFTAELRFDGNYSLTGKTSVLRGKDGGTITLTSTLLKSAEGGAFQWTSSYDFSGAKEGEIYQIQGFAFRAVKEGNGTALV
ncbi:MAG: hypothetical protein HY548_08480, partial [Elusimicrobia bacterium]|nr:hypothetical protein [Elusimicrobiota bacterium]